ncbi:MAG: UDP-N-acetylmuramoyl-L-alanine--D-glutamate ligase [Bdellovibrionota bacterium]
MKNISHLKNTNFTIAGAARSGISCAKLLKKFGLKVFLTEEKKLSTETEAILKEIGISFEQEGHSIDKIINNTDILIISPGILLSSPLVIAAKKNNILVASEVEVASWFFPENVICCGITGTNGKSTTTHYLANLLKLEHAAVACGNIGTPVSEAVFNLYEKNLLEDNYYLCIELSSYQLETIYSMGPLCTCFLNLQNDHLARYENMDEYLKAKWRLILLTRDDGLAIIEENVLARAVHLGLSMPKCKIFVLTEHKPFTHRQQQSEYKNTGINLPIAIYKELKNLSIEQLIPSSSLNHAHVAYDANTNSAQINFNDHEKWDVKNSCLNGKHNIINILVASLMAEFSGLYKNRILRQWEKETTKYAPLPHRLEHIGSAKQIYIDSHKNKKTVTIINDSKATNVESTLVALQAFHKPIRLLLGGEAKGDSYLPIIEITNKDNLIIYPFGKAAPIIREQLSQFKNVRPHNFSNMLAAANEVLLECENGDIILLSPACSSFDEFKDFEHRGNVFRAWAISCFEENKS